jgi:hypothetical protein
MVSLDLAISAGKLLYFENMVIPLEKDKKSFLHGVHIKNPANACNVGICGIFSFL